MLEATLDQLVEVVDVSADRRPNGTLSERLGKQEVPCSDRHSTLPKRVCKSRADPTLSYRKLCLRRRGPMRSLDR